MLNNKVAPYIALLIANFIYAANYTIAQTAMEAIPPFGMIVIRVVISSALFWLVSFAMGNEKIQSKQDYFRLALCAVFGVALNQLMFFKGLSMTNPINPAIMMTTTPVLVLLISLIYLKEKITWEKTTGLVLGMGGAIGLILMKTSGEGMESSALGDFFVFINAASYGTYLVLAKPLFKKYQAITIIKWIFTFGIIMVMPFGVGQLDEVDWKGLDNDTWIALGYVVLMTTFFAYLFNAWALKKVTPTVVSFFIYLQPILASVIAIMIGKDELTRNKVIFALIIFIGVYLVSKPKKVKA